mmetsp:Transcript_60157/g.130468  ORF Transcript_60157/g.130468 Transcript_60157/m.130468 type:complete len:194 (+) Transcript_60157:46-627(+)|eukprot:CAMPEP_0170570370 /NCGR_PEP_ID=MMETSP0224-20130122/1068_1 /TAXON_ID=285029 /ORGANISM="Togula jolla, Strain CCCM 725" /LENGTH=193 /DNA_ID=CAMNT_0010892631 /DNA_START=46 /DNA_END=627 /DNA_ORIENTATION=-
MTSAWQLMSITALLAGTVAAIDANNCPEKNRMVSLNKCNGGPLIGASCASDQCPAHSTCSTDDSLGKVCKCEAPFCGVGKDCLCLDDTSGSCLIFDCWGWRDAKCSADHRCLCPEGTCAICGTCVALDGSTPDLAELPHEAMLSAMLGMPLALTALALTAVAGVAAGISRAWRNGASAIAEPLLAEEQISPEQ